MKKVGALRCAFYSIVAMIICVLVLYFIYKHNKIGRDEAMLVELGILTTGISYNLTKLNEYLKRYADVKAFYNIISFLCICLSAYIYFTLGLSTWLSFMLFLQSLSQLRYKLSGNILMDQKHSNRNQIKGTLRARTLFTVKYESKTSYSQFFYKKRPYQKTRSN